MYNIITNGTALLKVIAERGRAFTDARNAVIAHLLSVDVSQKTIVDESGVDKGDVSRVNKVLQGLKPAQQKALKGLNLGTLDVNDLDSMAAAVKLGTLFRRQKAAPAASKSNDKADKVEETLDVAAVVTEWLTTATAEQYDARIVILQNVLDTVAAEREAAQIEQAA